MKYLRTVSASQVREPLRFSVFRCGSGRMKLYRPISRTLITNAQWFN